MRRMAKRTKKNAPKPSEALPVVPTREFERAQLSTLQPHPRNYRRHPDEQIEHLCASIREHGVYRPIVVARDNTILAGHGLALACRKLGLLEVPVARIDVDPHSARALAVVAGDNEVGALAEIDDALLTELLSEIAGASTESFDALLGTGFDFEKLAAYTAVTAPPDKLRDTNAVAAEHWVGMPEYGTGERTCSLSVVFDSEAAREEFMRVHGFEPLRRTNNVWSMHWPVNAHRDVASVRVVGAGGDDE